jgi:DNA-binding LytR/AlgR family response regulator
MYQVIIVDDDPIVRSLIKSYLEGHSSFSLNGSYSSLKDPELRMRINKADLVFMDVEMPDGSAVEFMNTANVKADIIVITSDTKYAYWSYQIDALDFLLKPISKVRFDHALEKFTKSKQGKSIGDQILVKSGSEQIKINLNDILWIEGASEYLKIVTTSGKTLVYSNMKSMLLNLNKDFLRVHRSYIIPASKIERFTKKAVWIQGTEIPVSKTYAGLLQDFMEGQFADSVA